MKELIQAYGWEDLGPQKNSYMLSFKKDDLRLNWYFTTGTFSIQGPETNQHFKDIETAEQLEDILMLL